MKKKRISPTRKRLNAIDEAFLKMPPHAKYSLINYLKFKRMERSGLSDFEGLSELEIGLMKTRRCGKKSIIEIIGLSYLETA